MVSPKIIPKIKIEEPKKEEAQFINHQSSAQNYQPLIQCEHHYQIVQPIKIKRVRINVAGLIFETSLNLLNTLPNTLLGHSVKRSQYWDPYREEFFFDRHRSSFQAILHYYQSGGETLIYPCNVPEGIFENEVRFFELSPKRSIRNTKRGSTDKRGRVGQF